MIRHRFTSPKPDGPDTTKVRPSNWNATHQFVGEADQEWDHPLGALDVRVYADGTGATDATLGVRAAITAAGENGALWFAPGTEWLISSRLTPLAGQTWYGYGAKLRRADQVSTTTSSAITTSGAQTLTVASVTGLYVGKDVAVFNGSSYDVSNHNITAINGLQITLATLFTTAFPSGGTVVSSHFMIVDGQGTVTDFTVLGLEIDGNKANNTAINKWELQAEIYILADRFTCRDLYVHDAQTEGITPGGKGSLVDHCFVEDCNGNGIHGSGSTDLVIRNNYVRNVNLLGTSPGHQDGCIIFSNATGDTLVVGNYCENGISGVGSIDSAGNSGVIVQGNIIRDCPTNALDLISSDDAQGRVIITDNQIYNCGPITISNTDSTPSTGPYRVTFANNYVETTKMQVYRAFDILIANNHFSWAGNTTNIILEVLATKRASITGNMITGGQLGIGIQPDSTTTSEGISVRNNALVDQDLSAIRWISGSSVLQSNGHVAQGNTVLRAAGANVNYIAIVPQNGVTVQGNNFYLLSGLYAVQCPNGNTSVPGAIVADNVIRSSGLTASIKTFGGSQNNVIKDNYIQQAISDSGSPNNTVTGNVTIF